MQFVATILLLLATAGIAITSENKGVKFPVWLREILRVKQGTGKVQLQPDCVIVYRKNNCTFIAKAQGSGCQKLLVLRKILTDNGVCQKVGSSLPLENFYVIAVAADTCKKDITFNAKNSMTLNFIDRYLLVSNATMKIKLKDYLLHKRVSVTLIGKTVLNKARQSISISKDWIQRSYKIRITGNKVSIEDLLGTFRLTNQFFKSLCKVERQKVQNLVSEHLDLNGYYEPKKGFYFTGNAILRKPESDVKMYGEIIVLRENSSPVKFAIILKGSVQRSILPFLIEFLVRENNTIAAIDDVGQGMLSLSVADLSRSSFDKISRPATIPKGVVLQTVSKLQNLHVGRSEVAKDNTKGLRLVSLKLCSQRDEIDFNPNTDVDLPEFLERIHALGPDINFPEWLKKGEKVKAKITKVDFTGASKDKVTVQATVQTVFKILFNALDIDHVNLMLTVDKTTGDWDCGVESFEKKVESFKLDVSVVCDKGLRNFRVVTESSCLGFDHVTSMLKVNILPEALTDKMSKLIGFQIRDLRIESSQNEEDFLRISGKPLLFGLETVTLEGVAWIGPDQKNIAVGLVLKDINIGDVMKNLIGTPLQISWIGKSTIVLAMSNVKLKSLESSAQQNSIESTQTRLRRDTLKEQQIANKSLHLAGIDGASIKISGQTARVRRDTTSDFIDTFASPVIYHQGGFQRRSHNINQPQQQAARQVFNQPTFYQTPQSYAPQTYSNYANPTQNQLSARNLDAQNQNLMQFNSANNYIQANANPASFVNTQQNNGWNGYMFPQSNQQPNNYPLNQNFYGQQQQQNFVGSQMGNQQQQQPQQILFGQNQQVETANQQTNDSKASIMDNLLSEYDKLNTQKKAKNDKKQQNLEQGLVDMDSDRKRSHMPKRPPQPKKQASKGKIVQKKSKVSKAKPKREDTKIKKFNKKAIAKKTKPKKSKQSKRKRSRITRKKDEVDDLKSVSILKTMNQVSNRHDISENKHAKEKPNSEKNFPHNSTKLKVDAIENKNATVEKSDLKTTKSNLTHAYASLGNTTNNLSLKNKTKVNKSTKVNETAEYSKTTNINHQNVTSKHDLPSNATLIMSETRDKNAPKDELLSKTVVQRHPKEEPHLNKTHKKDHRHLEKEVKQYHDNEQFTIKVLNDDTTASNKSISGRNSSSAVLKDSLNQISNKTVQQNHVLKDDSSALNKTASVSYKTLHNHTGHEEHLITKALLKDGSKNSTTLTLNSTTTSNVLDSQMKNESHFHPLNTLFLNHKKNLTKNSPEKLNTTSVKMVQNRIDSKTPDGGDFNTDALKIPETGEDVYTPMAVDELEESSSSEKSNTIDGKPKGDSEKLNVTTNKSKAINETLNKPSATTKNTTSVKLINITTMADSVPGNKSASWMNLIGDRLSESRPNISGLNDIETRPKNPQNSPPQNQQRNRTVHVSKPYITEIRKINKSMPVKFVTEINNEDLDISDVNDKKAVPKLKHQIKSLVNQTANENVKKPQIAEKELVTQTEREPLHKMHHAEKELVMQTSKEETTADQNSTAEHKQINEATIKDPEEKQLNVKELSEKENEKKLEKEKIEQQLKLQRERQQLKLTNGKYAKMQQEHQQKIQYQRKQLQLKQQKEKAYRQHYQSLYGNQTAISAQQMKPQQSLLSNNDNSKYSNSDDSIRSHKTSQDLIWFSVKHATDPYKIYDPIRFRNYSSKNELDSLQSATLVKPQSIYKMNSYYPTPKIERQTEKPANLYESIYPKIRFDLSTNSTVISEAQSFRKPQKPSPSIVNAKILAKQKYAIAPLEEDEDEEENNQHKNTTATSVKDMYETKTFKNVGDSKTSFRENSKASKSKDLYDSKTSLNDQDLDYSKSSFKDKDLDEEPGISVDDSAVNPGNGSAHFSEHQTVLKKVSSVEEVREKSASNDNSPVEDKTENSKLDAKEKEDSGENVEKHGSEEKHGNEEKLENEEKHGNEEKHENSKGSKFSEKNEKENEKKVKKFKDDEDSKDFSNEENQAEPKSSKDEGENFSHALADLVLADTADKSPSEANGTAPTPIEVNKEFPQDDTGNEIEVSNNSTNNQNSVAEKIAGNRKQAAINDVEEENENESNVPLEAKGDLNKNATDTDAINETLIQNKNMSDSLVTTAADNKLKMNSTMETLNKLLVNSTDSHSEENQENNNENEDDLEINIEIPKELTGRDKLHNLTKPTQHKGREKKTSNLADGTNIFKSRRKGSSIDVTIDKNSTNEYDEKERPLLIPMDKTMNSTQEILAVGMDANATTDVESEVEYPPETRVLDKSKQMHILKNISEGLASAYHESEKVESLVTTDNTRNVQVVNSDNAAKGDKLLGTKIKSYQPSKSLNASNDGTYYMLTSHNRSLGSDEKAENIDLGIEEVEEGHPLHSNHQPTFETEEEDEIDLVKKNSTSLNSVHDSDDAGFSANEFHDLFDGDQKLDDTATYTVDEDRELSRPQAMTGGSHNNNDLENINNIAQIVSMYQRSAKHLTAAGGAPKFVEVNSGKPLSTAKSDAKKMYLVKNKNLQVEMEIRPDSKTNKISVETQGLENLVHKDKVKILGDAESKNLRRRKLLHNLTRETEELEKALSKNNPGDAKRNVTRKQLELRRHDQMLLNRLIKSLESQGLLKDNAHTANVKTDSKHDDARYPKILHNIWLRRKDDANVDVNVDEMVRSELRKKTILNKTYVDITSEPGPLALISGDKLEGNRAGALQKRGRGMHLKTDNTTLREEVSSALGGEKHNKKVNDGGEKHRKIVNDGGEVYRKTENVVRSYAGNGHERYRPMFNDSLVEFFKRSSIPAVSSNAKRSSVKKTSTTFKGVDSVAGLKSMIPETSDDSFNLYNISIERIRSDAETYQSYTQRKRKPISPHRYHPNHLVKNSNSLNNATKLTTNTQQTSDTAANTESADNLMAMNVFRSARDDNRNNTAKNQNHKEDKESLYSGISQSADPNVTKVKTSENKNMAKSKDKAEDKNATKDRKAAEEKGMAINKEPLSIKATPLRVISVDPIFSPGDPDEKNVGDALYTRKVKTQRRKKFRPKPIENEESLGNPATKEGGRNSLEKSIRQYLSLDKEAEHFQQNEENKFRDNLKKKKEFKIDKADKKHLLTSSNADFKEERNAKEKLEDLSEKVLNFENNLHMGNNEEERESNRISYAKHEVRINNDLENAQDVIKPILSNDESALNEVITLVSNRQKNASNLVTNPENNINSLSDTKVGKNRTGNEIDVTHNYLIGRGMESTDLIGRTMDNGKNVEKRFISEELKDIEINEGISMSLSVEPPESCDDDKLCMFLKENLDAASPLLLQGSFSTEGVKMQMRYPGSVTLTKTASLDSLELGVSIEGVATEMFIKAQLTLTDPPVTFQGKISMGALGNLGLDMRMHGRWEKVFGVDTLALQNAHFSMGYIPGAPMPAFEISGELLFGVSGSGAEIHVNIMLGFDPADPTAAYLYGEVSSLTVDKLLKAFNKTITLPTPVKESGFPEGVLITYTANPKGKEIAEKGITIEFGFTLSGTISILGYEVACIVKITTGEILLDVRMSPMELAGGLITLHRSEDQTNKGPVFVMRISKTEIEIRVEGAACLMGISGSANLLISNQDMRMDVKVNLFDLIEGTLLLEAGVKDGLSNAKFRIESCLTLRAEKLVEVIMDKLTALGKMATDAIQRAKEKVLQTKEMVDRAKQTVEQQLREIEQEENEIRGDVKQVIARRSAITKNCFRSCPKVCHAGYVTKRNCEQVLHQWTHCRSYKRCYRRKPKLQCILRCEMEKFRKRGFNFFSKLKSLGKLAILQVKKVALKLKKVALHLATIPFKLAEVLLKVVEKAVEKGVELATNLAKTALTEVFQFHHFCISANLGDTDGLCVGFNSSFSLFKQPLSLGGNLCINGKMFDSLGEDAINEQYPETGKMKESLKKCEKDFEKIDDKKRKAEQSEKKSNDNKEKKRLLRHYVPTPEERYFTKVLASAEPGYSFHPDIISSVYGHADEISTGDRVTTGEARKKSISLFAGDNDDDTPCSNHTRSVRAFKDITAGLQTMLSRDKRERDWRIEQREWLARQLEENKRMLKNYSSGASVYDKDQLDLYQDSLQQGFNRWSNTLNERLSIRNRNAVPRYVNDILPNQVSTERSTFIDNTHDVSRFIDFVRQLNDEASLSVKRSFLSSETKSVETKNISDITKAFEALLLNNNSWDLDTKLEHMRTIKQKLDLARTFTRLCMVTDLVKREELTNQESSNKQEEKQRYGYGRSYG